ncbi:MAG: hypothetical protein AAGF81_09115 [Pseudomonadota bacterium]
MIKARASLALRLTMVGLALLLTGCLRSGTPVVAPSAAAIEQAKAIGGSPIDPTHRDAADLIAIETGMAELPGGPGAADEPGTHAPPGDLTTGSTKKRIANAAPPETTKPAPNTKAIKAVAVPQVKGAPGAGNKELTVAMREVLRNAGWPVRSKPGDDTLTVRGKVEVGRTQKGKQPITLAWVVSDPTGDVLGTVKQANRVPAGSVDRGFGPSARFVAQAAAPGIFNLVKEAKGK